MHVIRKWPLPTSLSINLVITRKGNEQITFTGYDKVEVIEGGDSKKINNITYGTEKDDEFTFTEGNQVVFAGDGNNWIKVKLSDSVTYYPMLAGGNGYDRYETTSDTTGSKPPYCFIDDSDSAGEIVSNTCMLQGIAAYGESNSNGDRYWFQPIRYTSEYCYYSLYKNQAMEGIYQISDYPYNILIQGNAYGELGIATAEKQKTMALITEGNFCTALFSGQENVLMVSSLDSSCVYASSIFLDVYTQNAIPVSHIVVTPDVTTAHLTLESIVATQGYIALINTQDDYKLMVNYYTEFGNSLGNVQIRPPKEDIDCYTYGCYIYSNVPSTAFADNQAISAYCVKDSHSNYLVYAQELTGNPMSMPPSFLIRNFTSTVNCCFSIQLGAFGNDKFVVSIYDLNTTIFSYVYQGGSLLWEKMETSCSYPCDLVTLLPLPHQQEGFFMAYNDVVNGKTKTHTKIVYNSVEETSSTTLFEGSYSNTEYLSEYSAVGCTLPNNYFFIGDYSRGVLIDSKNQVLGGGFVTSPYFPYKYSAAQANENGDFVILGEDFENDENYNAQYMLTTMYVNTNALPVRPEVLPWESQKISSKEFQSESSSSLLRNISLPDVSFDAQIALMSIICDTIGKWISWGSSEEELHEISRDEFRTLKELKQQTTQLVEQLAQQTQYARFLNQDKQDCLDDATYLLKETNNVLKEAFEKQRVSGKIIDNVKNNIVRIHGWINKLPQQILSQKKISPCVKLSENHWSTGIWDARNNRRTEAIVGSRTVDKIERSNNLRVGY